MPVALITGASGGIGRSIAERFLEAGYNVAVTGRKKETLREVWGRWSSDRVLMLEADSTDLEACCRIVKETVVAFDRLDVLVNNVGGGVLGQTIGTISEADWAAMFRLNCDSCFFTLQAAVPALEVTCGCVVNFSSILAHRPVPGFLPYTASKAAVEAITAAAALELAPKGVRVLCISPATIQTHFHEAAGMSASAATTYYDAAKRTHPIGRVGQPEEVADMVLHLVSAKFMTGSVVHIDGGRMLTSAVAGQMSASKRD